ncbi:pH-response regulator protein palA/rim20, partial [Spiromyces aspiralis]
MSFFSWGFGGGYSASSGVDDANGGAGGCLPYIPFKRTERVGYTKPLTEYIVQSYAEPPEAYRDDLRVLDELRESATMSTTATSSDVNPSTLQRNIRYYGQLTFMLAKFPANIE